MGIKRIRNQEERLIIGKLVEVEFNFLQWNFLQQYLNGNLVEAGNLGSSTISEATQV